jgi:hypothetical protein
MWGASGVEVGFDFKHGRSHRFKVGLQLRNFLFPVAVAQIDAMCATFVEEVHQWPRQRHSNLLEAQSGRSRM